MKTDVGGNETGMSNNLERPKTGIRGGLKVSQTIHELDPLSDQQISMTYKISIGGQALSVQVSTDLLVPSDMNTHTVKL